MTAAQRKAAAMALMERVRGLPECSGKGTVAAYVSMGTEPGTGPLIDALRKTGTRVLLPVLLPDNDLDWAEYQGSDTLARTGRGLFEPTGPRLGPEAVAQAGLILLPGLAVDARGVRLGRGGGSYDRVLARVRQAAAHPALVVVLYADEVVASVPAEPHDHLVDAALTPQGVHRFRG
ncbi:5-formyltetrahydrofolate cyclo-ligase [Actinacidiphila bryophytorum]|uniref:5-formyltetrahydrofolate cyclo-ligase n=1 Tax=Actinacidiphila bryophytorum TaxID=1436133 RepID=A0A9W4H0J9_9ACTN|nr:5-formyltetrahydrofolate cyclo-ligase [Actinacidiphila bryophytorum]